MVTAASGWPDPSGDPSGGGGGGLTGGEIAAIVIASIGGAIALATLLFLFANSRRNNLAQRCARPASAVLQHCTPHGTAGLPPLT